MSLEERIKKTNSKIIKYAISIGLYLLSPNNSGQRIQKIERIEYENERQALLIPKRVMFITGYKSPKEA